MARMINEAACRRYALDYAARTRAHKFTRVASNLMDHLDGAVLRAIESVIKSHPSMGTTLAVGPIRAARNGQRALADEKEEGGGSEETK